MLMREDVYVEMDLPYCSLNFGQAPCTATGTPCFNTRNTFTDCGDPANYTAGTLTVRFVKNNGIQYWPVDGTHTLSILQKANSTSCKIDPAESMGARAKLTIQLDNCKSTMRWLDKNVDARNLIASDSSSFDKGTLLGKFKALNPFIFGAPVRVYRSESGANQAIEHYIVENMSGPDNSGGMSISCVDALKLTNGDSSLWPPASKGSLAADIDNVVTTLTAAPVGIGATYPASGKISVGNEAMTFTRVGDVFTVVRAVQGKLEDHKLGETIQIVGEFSGATFSDIIYQLLDEGTPLDVAAIVNKPDWDYEADAFQPNLYSATIVKPEPVNNLINEMIQQAGLNFWFDVLSNQIRITVLRPSAGTKSFDDSNIAGFSQEDDQQARLSQVLVYYNMKDPFKRTDDLTNYYSVFQAITAENLYLTEKIRKIHSRWLPVGGQAGAEDIANRLLARYKNPPRDFEFSLLRKNLVRPGDAIGISHRAMEDGLGNQTAATAFIISRTPSGIMDSINAVEFDFSAYDGPSVSPIVNIPIQQPFLTNLNLRELYDANRSSLSGVTQVIFTVRSGTVIGSINNALYSMTVGDFEGVAVKLVIVPGAFIVGKAGEGSNVDRTILNPIRNGGPAILADYPISIENLGAIGGGGGASGQISFRFSGSSQANGASLGGAGYNYGESRTGASSDDGGLGLFSTVENGTTTAGFVQHYAGGGLGVTILSGGNAGNLGQPGANNATRLGGLAGVAVTGNSNITWITAGDIRGAII